MKPSIINLFKVLLKNRSLPIAKIYLTNKANNNNNNTSNNNVPLSYNLNIMDVLKINNNKNN